MMVPNVAGAGVASLYELCYGVRVSKLGNHRPHADANEINIFGRKSIFYLIKSKKERIALEPKLFTKNEKTLEKKRNSKFYIFGDKN